MKTKQLRQVIFSIRSWIKHGVPILNKKVMLTYGKTAKTLEITVDYNQLSNFQILASLKIL